MTLPTDAEILEAGAHGSVMAVVLALRVLADEGTPPSVPALVKLTGYSRSQVYEARKSMDELWPAWREPAAELSPNGSSPVDKTPPSGVSGPSDTLPFGGPADRTPVPVAPGWREAIGERMAAVVGARSWDLYADVYEPAWDLVLAGPNPNAGDGIALATHYIETVVGDELTAGDRSLVAMLIRQYGKAGIFGLSRAVGATENATVRDYYRYARQVCARIVAEIRANEGAAE